MTSTAADTSDDEPYCKLRNFGNTCYYNSAHQCLMNAPSVFDTIVNKSDQFKVDKEKYNFSIYEQLLEVFQMMRDNPGEVMRPRRLISTLDNIMKAKRFEVTAQNDSHELYQLLIQRIFDEAKTHINPDVMMKQILQKYVQNNNYTPATTNQEIISLCAKNWTQEFMNEYCPLTDIFFGQFLRSTQCPNPSCQNISYSPAVFKSIELPITAPTVQECLNNAFKMHEVNDITCDKCNIKHKSLQSIDQIWMEPQVLVLQIKRYEFKRTPKGIQIMKNNTPVQFSESNELTLPLYNNAHKRYKFYGVVCHMGHYDGGHYVAYVYNYEKKKYYLLNDHLSNSVQYSQIPMSQVCLTVYEKI